MGSLSSPARVSSSLIGSKTLSPPKKGLSNLICVTNFVRSIYRKGKVWCLILFSFWIFSRIRGRLWNNFMETICKNNVWKLVYENNMWKHKKGLEPPIREKVSLVKIVFRLFSEGYETTILENNSICVPNFVHSIYRKWSLKCFHSIYRKGSLSCFLFHFWDFFVGVFLPCGVKQVNLPLLDKWLMIVVRNVRVFTFCSFFTS